MCQRTDACVQQCLHAHTHICMCVYVIVTVYVESCHNLFFPQVLRPRPEKWNGHRIGRRRGIPAGPSQYTTVTRSGGPFKGIS